MLVFFLNGDKVEVSNPDPAQSLADYLRGEGFTGTKVGCGRGLCGACTVMLSSYDPHYEKVCAVLLNLLILALQSLCGIRPLSLVSFLLFLANTTRKWLLALLWSHRTQQRKVLHSPLVAGVYRLRTAR